MYVFLDPDELPVGWHVLCLSLDHDLAELCREGIIENFEVFQLKEKFGELRLYFSAEKGYLEAERLINDYAHVSYWTCCECGAFPATRMTDGWIMPFCEACAKKIRRTRNMSVFDPVYHINRLMPGGETVTKDYDASYVVDRIKAWKEMNDIKETK